MRRLFLTLILATTLTGAMPTNAQRHRHTPRTTAISQTAKTDSKAEATSTTPNTEEGITAYSDTTSVDTSAMQQVTTGNDDDFDRDFEDFITQSGKFFSSGFAGGLVMTILLVSFIIMLLMPLIIILLIIRYLMRRHNDRTRIMEKAIEQGIPLSDEQLPLSYKSAEYMWRRGVRNTSLGVGLMLFFWFLGANPLIGIGALVACLGGGQMYMAHSKRDTSKDKEE